MPTKAIRADGMPTIDSLDELAALVKRHGTLHVRRSPGPDADADGVADPASGCELPGLPARPLNPPDWWVRPLEDWLSLQLDGSAGARHWVLTGTDMGVDADCLPLIGHVRPMGWLGDGLLAEAAERRCARLGAGVVTPVG